MLHGSRPDFKEQSSSCPVFSQDSVPLESSHQSREAETTWRNFQQVLQFVGFPGGTSGKEPTCQFRRHRFKPWVREIPWRKAWKSTPVFLPGESHGQRSLASHSPWGHKESDTTERLTLPLVLLAYVVCSHRPSVLLLLAQIPGQVFICPSSPSVEILRFFHLFRNSFSSLRVQREWFWVSAKPCLSDQN